MLFSAKCYIYTGKEAFFFYNDSIIAPLKDLLRKKEKESLVKLL